MSTSLKTVHGIHKTCFAPLFLLLWCVPYRGEFSVFSSVGRGNLENCSEPRRNFTLSYAEKYEDFLALYRMKLDLV